MAELFFQGNVEFVRKLNLMVQEVNSLMNMQGDPFIRVSSDAAGTTLRLDVREVIQRIPRFTGSGGGGTVVSGWFQLIDTSSSPMLGLKQTCNNGSFSDEDDSSPAPTTSIYPHPQSILSDYKDDTIIFANFIGNCWVSVNQISDISDAAEGLFAECLV